MYVVFVTALDIVNILSQMQIFPMQNEKSGNINMLLFYNWYTALFVAVSNSTAQRNTGNVGQSIIRAEAIVFVAKG